MRLPPTFEGLRWPALAGSLAVVLGGLQAPVRAEPAAAALPPAVERPVDFRGDVAPILLQRCASCHTGEDARSGFRIDTRQTFLEGGYSGEAVAPGASGESYLVELVAGGDSGLVMPLEGQRLSAEEVGLLRAWIDQGVRWDEGYDFAAAWQSRIRPRRPKVPPTADKTVSAHPIDRFLAGYFAEHDVSPGELVSGRVFARRVSLDLIGLLPAPDALDRFLEDTRTDRRARLIDALLENREAYAVHWLSFWNDLLRNDYRGTGYIDGGRKQITGWLFDALYHNKPYDRFVHELVSPSPESEGFVRGIKWRGVVNASQRAEMQAAQSVAQVFLGTNLKCASCHDSFVNQWRLEDSWSLAGVFADEPLELYECNKPTGQTAQAGFLFEGLGEIDPELPRAERMEQLADVMVQPDNGRLARTVVNRLWQRLFGAGLVEPVDDLDRPAFCQALMDYLAADLADHGYDVKRTIRLLCTSTAYQRRAVAAPRPEAADGVFRGPLVRRMTAEQFVDAVADLTGVRPVVSKRLPQKALPKEMAGKPPARAALADADLLMRALGRPNREQVVTRRDSIATTLQALELANGDRLNTMIQKGAQHWLDRTGGDTGALVDRLYQTALGRRPDDAERAAALELVGGSPGAQGVEDLLWTLCMLPEFQLIY